MQQCGSDFFFFSCNFIFILIYGHSGSLVVGIIGMIANMETHLAIHPKKKKKDLSFGENSQPLLCEDERIFFYGFGIGYIYIESKMIPFGAHSYTRQLQSTSPHNPILSNFYAKFLFPPFLWIRFAFGTSILHFIYIYIYILAFSPGDRHHKYNYYYLIFLESSYYCYTVFILSQFVLLFGEFGIYSEGENEFQLE